MRVRWFRCVVSYPLSLFYISGDLATLSSSILRAPTPPACSTPTALHRARGRPPPRHHLLQSPSLPFLRSWRHHLSEATRRHFSPPPPHPIPFRTNAAPSHEDAYRGYEIGPRAAVQLLRRRLAARRPARERRGRRRVQLPPTAGDPPPSSVLRQNAP